MLTQERIIEIFKTEKPEPIPVKVVDREGFAAWRINRFGYDWIEIDPKRLRTVCPTEDSVRFVLWHELGHKYTLTGLDVDTISYEYAVNSLFMEKLADGFAAMKTSKAIALQALNKLLDKRIERSLEAYDIIERIHNINLLKL